MENDFRKDLECLINKHSKETGSDTPDFILAEYLTRCLAVYDKAVMHREEWYGRSQHEVDETLLPQEPAGGSYT